MNLLNQLKSILGKSFNENEIKKLINQKMKNLKKKLFQNLQKKR